MKFLSQLPPPDCDQATNQRMARLKPKGSAAQTRPSADIVLFFTATSGSKPSQIVARGHLDEVTELKRGGSKLTGGTNVKSFFNAVDDQVCGFSLLQAVA